MIKLIWVGGRMKPWIYILFFNIAIPAQAMFFDIESQEHYPISRIKQEKDHVVINMPPLTECAICYEDKHLTGSIPCEEGDKHPKICDDCMHDLYEKEHVSAGTCPFCRRDLLKPQNLACSICKEKFKNSQEPQPPKEVGCWSCFTVLCRFIRNR